MRECGAAILGEQERDHEVENDENQIGRAGPDALKAHDFVLYLKEKVQNISEKIQD